MNIVAFPEPARFDMVEALRDLASKFESGALTLPVAMAYVAETGDGLTCGLLGMTSEIHACGLLTIGAQFMGLESCGDEE